MSTTVAPPSPKSATKSAARGGSIYLAFVPWILFSVIAQHDTVAAAAVVALVAAIAVAVPSLIAGRPKVLELGTVAAFVGFTVVALVLDPAAGDFLTRYARAIAAGLLALIAFGSLLFAPFTEQYARESVPREFWSSPRFQQVNRQLTAMWGCVFSVMLVSHVVAGLIDTHRSNTIFNWVIPIVLVVWAVKRTGAVSEDR